jgi:glycosyltransferase involved in cell wall biosynthesis
MQVGKHKVLVIAYYFPPLGLSGVFRIAKFVKYLPQYDWHATVLTVGDVAYYAHDEALLREVEESGARIVTTRTLDPLSIAGKRTSKLRVPPDRLKRILRGITHVFLQPDNKIGWKRHAVRKGLELLNEEPYDAILATAPPFTDFLIGLELSQKSGVPLVVDYRDPWLENKHFFYATPMHRRYAARLEEMVLKSAEAIVVVNRRIKEQLISRWRFLTHEAVRIIPSGYDRSDIERAEPERFRSGKLRLTYSGLFDARRSPRVFFEALSKVFARFPEARDDIDACFVGTFRKSHRKLAEKMGVATALVTPGYVEHRRVMDWLLSSDVLWLTIFDPSITPGKLYEYMGTGKPILALAPEGAVRTVLADYKAATCVDPKDADAIAEQIERYWRAWSAGELPTGSTEVTREFDCRATTGELARVLSHSMKL